MTPSTSTRVAHRVGAGRCRTCRSGARSGSVAHDRVARDEGRAVEDLEDRVEGGRQRGGRGGRRRHRRGGHRPRAAAGRRWASMPPARRARPPAATATPAPHDRAPPTASAAAAPAPSRRRRRAKPAGRLGKTATVALLTTGATGSLRVALGRARHHERLGLRRAALGEGPVERVHVVLDPAPDELLLRAREDARVAGCARGHLDVVPVGRRVRDAEVHARAREAGAGAKQAFRRGYLPATTHPTLAVVDGDALRRGALPATGGRRGRARPQPSACHSSPAGPWETGRARDLAPRRGASASVAPGRARP